MTARVSFEVAYEQARQLLGQVHRHYLGRIHRKDFQRFAVAVDDLNENYLNEVPAVREGRPGPVAPPLYLSSVMGWGFGPLMAELRRDGTVRREYLELPLDGFRLMGGGQDVEFLSDIVDGDEIFVDVSLEEVDLREGRSGSLLILKMRSHYSEADGRKLVTCRETFIAR